MHNAALRSLAMDWVYLAFEVAPGHAVTAIAGARALGIERLSVTMPHKAAVIPALDRLSEVAEAVGAVNTVVRLPDGVLKGENTDGPGFLQALRGDEGFDPAGRRCLVIGAGGAARAVVKALSDAGAEEVVVVNRTRANAEAAAALAGPVGRVGLAAEAGEAELVVSAVPLGMAGHDDVGLPVDPTDLGPGQLVVDLVTHPTITPLVEAARARGARSVNGLGMLVHQAVLQFRLWTGEDAPVEAMRTAALAALSR